MPEPGLTEEVRNTCKAVAEQARHVRINHDAIAPYASSLPFDRTGTPLLDPARHYLGHGEETLAYVITLDSINFGSGFFPHLRKRPGMSGYFTIASSLNDLYRKHGPLSPEDLIRVTGEDCTGIFNQDPFNSIIQELMGLFAKALNDLGYYVLERYHGSFRELVEAAGSSAEGLAQILSRMPCFMDVEPYHEIPVSFYKRAQLAASDLAIAFGGKGFGHFYDLERLTIFADNLVPHVLRVDGILLYEGSLIDRILSGELLPSGSPEEVEIRACAVHAVELLKAKMGSLGHLVTSYRLDYLLWNRGQQPYYKAIPRHRTRSIFY